MSAVARTGRHIAALASAVAGFYLGLIAGLESLGLEGGAEAFPLFTAAGAGAVTGAILGLFDGRARLTVRTAVGLATGLALGVALWAVDPGLEWHVAVLALMSQGLAWWTWSEQIHANSDHEQGLLGI